MAVSSACVLVLTLRLQHGSRSRGGADRGFGLRPTPSVRGNRMNRGAGSTSKRPAWRGGQPSFVFCSAMTAVRAGCILRPRRESRRREFGRAESPRAAEARSRDRSSRPGSASAPDVQSEPGRRPLGEAGLACAFPARSTDFDQCLSLGQFCIAFGRSSTGPMSRSSRSRSSPAGSTLSWKRAGPTCRLHGLRAPGFCRDGRRAESRARALAERCSEG